MTTSPSTPAISVNTHLRVATSALLLLALTSLHHAYGAMAFGTPWRLHILLFVVPAAIVIAVLLYAGWVANTARSARLLTWAAAAVVFVVPIVLVGYVEGGYNHVVKNIVYFGFGEAAFHAIFPTPPYEMPKNLFFEITGIAQFPLSVLTTVLTVRMLRSFGK
ncbi:hypothetical protein [Aminobacter carboxidus]|uniref:Transmembrane protein n=1 Tax=Aminobacter carboxidus TaxID=376165 RepID=A0ABR9GVV9_9HYPH|nr:hypothetical protein [Aminobacter carboxidus]MBE1207811.1 hypothetical protein [Aminobacter carboxidus]